jgi:hypothetical protein
VLTRNSAGGHTTGVAAVTSTEKRPHSDLRGRKAVVPLKGRSGARTHDPTSSGGAGCLRAGLEMSKVAIGPGVGLPALAARLHRAAELVLFMDVSPSN